MAFVDFDYTREVNPVDLIEAIAALNDWVFERTAEDEVALSARGTWSDYQISFSWMGEMEALHLACAFDVKVPETRKTEVVRLLAQINEQLWCGHFDLWAKDGLVMYRNTLPLNGDAQPTTAQIEALYKLAVENCDRYFQAFQFVLWAGKPASEALACILFDTEGEA